MRVPMTVAMTFALCLPAGAADDLQDKIRQLRPNILPETVYIHVIGRNYEAGKSANASWTGSGVVISSDGYVASNHHVLDQARRVRVMLSNGKAYDGKVIGTDAETDLGLLRLVLPDDAPPLPFARFADSDTLSAGDFVLTVGSPFGLTRSISFGIVNNPAQVLVSDGLYNWIQTDAAINSGNSGGPLIDLEGRVVGINTLSLRGTGLGFAIPAAVARDILGRIKVDGRVLRSNLGLSLQALRDFNRDTYVPGERGVLIVGTEPNSPATAAGFRPGDFLLSIEGKDAGALYPESLAAVKRRLTELPAGRSAAFEVMRNGQTLRLTATPTPRAAAAPDKEQFDAEEWMMTVKSIGEDEDSLERYFRAGGVGILEVAEPGNAKRSGLQSKDIILAVDGADIKSIDDLRQSYWRSMAKRASDRLILVSVLRRGRRFEVALDYSHSKDSQEVR